MRFAGDHQRIEMLVSNAWALVGDTLNLEGGFGVQIFAPGDIRFLPTGMAILPGGADQATLQVAKVDRIRTVRVTRYGRIQ